MFTFPITLFEVPVESPSCDLSAFSYSGKSFTPSIGTNALSMFFDTTGTIMYHCSNDTDTIYQYTLSIAWDISTASYASKSFSVGGQDATPTGMYIDNSGTKLFVLGSANDTIYQYTLSIAWDISTASYDSKSFFVGSQESIPQEIHLKDDGTKLFVTGNSDAIYQYTLSTAFDISTASYDSISFSTSGQTVAPLGMFFADSGRTILIADVGGDCYQYDLSTAWDISTAVYNSTTLDISTQLTDPQAIHFDDTCSNFFVVSDGQGSKTYQFSV